LPSTSVGDEIGCFGVLDRVRGDDDDRAARQARKRPLAAHEVENLLVLVEVAAVERRLKRIDDHQ
jgi:hypothetical protein